MSALQVRYRPKSIKGIYGNSALKESLTSALSKEDKPTSFLFTGKSGCGKTTFGRVIANELCIDPINTHIYNAASTRGIDTIREIIQEAKKVPLFGGNRRIYILEECFPKGTNISTPNGNIPIETIRPGDSIFNIEGLSTVKSIFKNIVPLERIVKLHLSGNKEIVCSKDHLFLTENGWIKAIDLKNNLILTQSCDSLIDTLSQEVSKNEYVQMSNVFTDTTKQNPKYQNLWTMQKSSNRLFRMWENIYWNTNPPTRPKHCSKSCAGKWRNSQDSFRAKVYTKESAKNIQTAILKSMKEKPEIWGEIRKASSERMTKNNPSKNIINIEKGKYTRRLNGTLNTLEGHYGGNGRELTQPQILLASLLGWKTEINILTGIKKKKGIPQDFPSVYKIDIGNEKLKLAIEVDGQKHKLKKFLFRDLKKEIKLRSLGWKILRFTNEDVMNKTSQVLLQITKEVRAIRSSMI